MGEFSHHYRLYSGGPAWRLFGESTEVTFCLTTHRFHFLNRQWLAALSRRAYAPASGVAEKKLNPKEREAHFRPLSSLTWKEAFIVGLAQSLALIPGISRSGATMVAGLGVGLNHEDAARFSFLLGTPIIGAAALLEVPQLIGQPRSVLLLVMMGRAW